MNLNIQQITNTNSKRSIRFISTIEEANWIDEENDKIDEIILSGHAIYLALSSSGLTPSDPEQYIEQTPRPVSSQLLKRKKEDSLRVWVSKEMLIAAQQFKRQPRLAVDYYLRWGFRQKMDTVLIGGAENDRTNMECLAFKGGRLINCQERTLRQRSHQDFANQLDLALSDIASTFRGYALAVVNPIEPFTDYPCARLCQTIADEPFRRRITVPLEYGEKRSHARRYMLPVFIVISALTIYCGLIAFVWGNYNDALTEYRSVNNGINGFDENMLRVLEARRGFLKAPQTQTATVNNARMIATAIAGVDHIHVRKLFVRNDDAGSTFMELSQDAKFGVVAEIPLDNDSMLEQARPILDQLAASTGSKLREIRQAVTTDTASGQKRLTMTFEGR